MSTSFEPSRDVAVEALATDLIASATDAIVVKTPAGAVLSWNAAAERLFGYAEREALGQNVPQLPSERADEERQLIARLRSQERIAPFATVRLRKDGTPVTVSLGVSAIRNSTGSVVALAEIAREVDAQLACTDLGSDAPQNVGREGCSEPSWSSAQIRLYQEISNLLLQATQRTDAASDVLDLLVGECSYLSLYLCEENARGGATKLVAVRSAHTSNPGRSGYPEQARTLAQRSAEQRRTLISDEPPGAAAAGRSSSLRPDAAGAARGATWFALPLVYQDHLLGVLVGRQQGALPRRERSWLAALARQIGHGLHALAQAEAIQIAMLRVRARSQRHQAQQRELQQINRRSDFLSTMSHELRTPLNAILGFSQLLLDGPGGLVDAKQRDNVNEILRSGRRLLAFINDILDLSRIEGGRMELLPLLVDPRTLAGDVVNGVRERALRGGVQVSWAVAEGLEVVDVDAAKVRRILGNLLSNAVNFTPRGGSVHLDVSATEEGDLVMVVEDTGCGISEAQLPLLFRRFEQVVPGASRNRGSLGLGLVMVKAFTELHGGTVSVQSQVDQGSRFLVKIPGAAARV